MLSNKIRTLKLLFCVALGGAFGALARFFLNDFLQNTIINVYHTDINTSYLSLFLCFFPFGILVCNIIGSLGLGIFMSLEIKNSAHTHHFFAIGFLGSLTTFSTFVFDTAKIFLPSLMYKTSFQKHFPELSGKIDMIMDYPPVALEKALSYQYISIGILNIFLNFTLCICCVYIGSKIIKKSE